MVTRKIFEAYMNEIGTPPDDRKSNGGRIPDRSKYGTWTRRNDPTAFEVSYQEHTRKEKQ